EEFSEPHGERSSKRRKLSLDKKKLSDRDTLSESTQGAQIISQSDRRRDFRSDEHKPTFDHREYVDVHMTWYENQMDNVFKQFSQQVLSEQQYGNGMDSEGKAKFGRILDNELSALFCFDDVFGLL